MIIRVFTVRIHPGMIEEFEEKYRTISVPFMESCAGMRTVSIGRPTPQTPDAYVMVSYWDSEDALAAALGDDWACAHIPSGMEHLIETCSVQHFEQMPA